MQIYIMLQATVADNSNYLEFMFTYHLPLTTYQGLLGCHKNTL
ncbi:hypothetical protein ENHYD8BJ_80162 [Enhydrobacter sp. 8BJ]|nr:hypothetical protein ENHYD8BJ_80162 [Enhydrobacter sp. 8BJ]